MIEVQHLSKTYTQDPVLKDINCIINDGDVIAVIGPSGCGKSTFVRCLNLLEKPSSGNVLYNGKDITKEEMPLVEVRKHAGMIFQNFNLYPQYTVLENIMIPQIDILKRSKQEAYDKAMEYLQKVGLKNQANKNINQISGGQKQRVAIARTLAMDNKVLLMDEPTSALDPVTVREVQYVIRNLANAGKTMVIVTHDMRFARKVANRVFFITDGIIYEEGKPSEVFDNPQKEKTKAFVQCINEKTIKITQRDFEFTSIISDIGEFIERNDLSRRQSASVEAVIEELVLINLLPHLSPEDLVEIILSYSEKTEEIKLDVSYNKNYNPLNNIDPVSKALLEHNSERISMIPADGDKTELEIVVRKNNIDID